MPLHNGINSIIHLASSADTSGYTYTQVYAGAAGDPTINGTPTTMVAGSTIDILVNSIIPTGTGGTLTDIYVIGDAASTTNPGGEIGRIL